MSALIGRLSKLTGPRYTMDVAIALATDFWPKDRIQNIVYNDDGDPWVYFTDGPDLPLPPAYTASVDAAIALAERVLPGWYWGITQGDDGEDAMEFQGNVWPSIQPYPAELEQYGYHKFPAIALLIALLRAKEASKL